MTTEPAHTWEQLQDDITTMRAHYISTIKERAWFANVLDAAQRYCNTLPRVHHQKAWAILDRDGAFRGIYLDRATAVNCAELGDFAVCELTGSCKL